MRRYLAVAAACFAAVTCTLVEGVGTGTKILFTLQASDTLQVVGAKIPFLVGPNQHVDVARGTTPLVGARVQLGSDNRSILDVSGDTLVVLARGTAHVTITLLGSNLGDSPPETTLTVRAVAGGVAIRDSTSITLKSLNDSLAIHTNVLALGRVPIVPSDTTIDSLISSDTTIVKVVKLPNALPFVIARANGNATLTVVADTARNSIPIHVVQALKKYTFTPSSLTMTALTADTVVVVAPSDARGNPIPLNTPGLPTPVFSAATAGVFTVTPLGTDSVKIHSVNPGTVNLNVHAGTIDTLLVIAVQQVAQSVAIPGSATDTIFAINDTVTLNPIAFDSKNVTIQGQLFLFSALDPTTVTVTNGVVHGLKLGSTTVTARMNAATATVTIVVLNVPKAVLVTHNVDLTTVGDSASLSGSVLNKLGVAVSGVPITWTAIDTTIAAVSPTTGVVVGRGIGVTKVIGSITAGAADTSTVTVENRISQVKITSTDTTLVSIGDTITVRTNFRNSRGAPVPNSAATWTSTDPTVVSVANGFLTAKAAGLSAIYATDPLNAARFDSVRVTVTNAPASVALNRHLDTLTSPSLQIQYLADVRNARTAVITNPTLTWRTTNNTVASVTASGLVLSLAVGTTKIIAEANGTLGLHADTATLVVINVATQLNVSPPAATIPSIGATVTLSANARNASGGSVGSVTFLWSSSDTTVAKVDTTGVVTGIGVGTATVTAKLSTLTAGAAITVTNAPDSIRITSGPITLASINDSIQPAATLKNAIGAALPRTAAQWLSDDGTIARVTSDGTVIAVAAGATKIRAQNALNTARRDSLNVTVTNAPASIVVSPKLDTLPSLGRSATYVATVRNARGDVIVGASILWLSRTPSIVSINAATGNATSVGSGTTFVVGAAGAVADSGRAVVSNNASSISASPAPVTLTSIGQNQALTTAVRNEQGNLIATPNVAFSSGNAAIATVNSSGMVTAMGVGSTTITVVSDAVSTPVTVTVTNYPTLVDITSNDTTLASINDSYSASVNFRNGLNTVLPRDAVTWSTGNQLVAVVSSTGVISAVGVGATYIRAVSPGASTIRDSVLVTVTNAPATLTVAPSGTTTLASIGVTANFTANVRNARGDSIASPNPSVTWTSRTPSVATVSGTGVVTTVAQGSSIIVATAGAAKDSATASVAQLASTSQAVIQTSASSITADGSSTVTITVRARDANGRNVRVPGTTVAMSLSGTGTLSGITTIVDDSTFTRTLTAPSTSGNGTVSATVNGTAITSGNQTVTYTAGAATRYVVTSSNATPTVATQVTITAQLTDGNSNPVATTGKTVTWSSTGGGSFGSPTSLTNASGVATVSFTVSATAPTTHLVTATDNTALTGTSGQILTVSSAATNYLVTPSTTSPAAGGSVTVTAQLRDAGNNAIALAGQVVAWTNNNSGVFGFSAGTSTTNASGIATITLTTPATPAGQAATVTATTGSVSGSSAAVTTVPGAASATTTTITSNTGSVTAGGAATITVHSKDANSNALTASGGAVVLATTIGSLGTVTDNANGTYTATLTSSTSGTATISGTIGGIAIAGGNASVTVSPATASAAQTVASVPAGTVGAATSVTVTAKDAAGNNVGIGGATVIATVSGANTATPTVTDVGNGTYTFSYTPTGAGTDAITIKLNTVPISGSPYSSVVSSGVLNGFQIETQGGGAIPSQASGTPFNIRVTARDAGGNLVTTFTGTVDLSSTGFTGLQTAAFSAGVLAIQSVTINGTGSFTITATKHGSTEAGTSNSFTVNPAGASVLFIQTQPSANATAGTAFGQQPAVQIKDAQGNVVTSDNTTIVTATRLAGSGTLQGTTTATASAGVATFTNLSYNVAETITIRFTSTSPVLTAATSNNVAVAAASASTISVTQSPTASPQSGIAFPQQPTIQLRDAQGNAVATSGVHVVASITAGGGTLGGTTDVTTDGTGLATFTNLSLTGTIGARTLTFTVSSPFSATTTASVTLVAGTASQLVIATQPSATPTAGISFATQPVIQIQDAQGNVVLTDNATVVTAARLGGSGTLQGTLTATAVNGVATFTNLAHNVATAVTIQFTAGGLTSATSSTVTVTAGAAAALTILTQPSATATAGVALTNQPAIEVRDAFNNIRTGDNTTVVTATRLAGTGTLQGTLTATAVSGVATFTNLAHNVATTITIQFASGNLTATTSNNVVVSAAAASAAQTTASVPAGSVGVATAVTVTAKDAFGNSVGTGGATVAATVSGANSATPTVTDHNDGTYTFSYTPSVAGTDAIAITLNATPIGGSPYSSVVSSGVVASFQVEAAGGGAIGTQAAGTSFNVRVTARDAGGNLVTAFTGTVDLTSTGTLLGGPTVLSGAFTGGVLSNQAVTITNTGSFTITATRTGGGPSGASTSFSVVAGAVSATTTTISANPTSVTAGGTSTITVTAKDALGNSRTTSSGTVTLATTSGTLSAVIDNGNGTYTAPFTGTSSGTATISGTIGGNAINPANDASVTVSVAAASQLTVTQSPTASPQDRINFAQQPTIQLRDAQGNAVASAGVTVHAAITAGGGTLTGTVDETTDGTGLATFTNLSITGTVGARTLTFSSSGLTSATANVTLLAGTATQLTVTQSPTASPQNTVAFPIQPTIQLRDADNNAVPSSGVTVHAAITAGGGTLNGTVDATTDGTGLATFANLSITGTIGARTLTFTSGVLTSSTAGVTLVAGPATQLVITQQPSATATAGTAFAQQPIVQVQDFSGNVVLTDNTTIVTAARATGAGTLQSTGSLTATASSGVATFSGLFYTVAENLTVRFSSGNLTAATSSPATAVSAAAASAAQTAAVVPPGSAGTLTSITVQAKDPFGNNETTGGSTVRVTVSGANTVAQFTATDNTNGTYSASYTPSVGGTDAIAITLGGTAIGGSPYSSVVSSGVVASFLVEAAGGGAIGTQTAGTPFSIRISARDASGNLVTSFTGTVDLSATAGTLSAGSGQTAAFGGGVLPSTSVTFSSTGSGTIKATNHAGTESGSASFSLVAGAVSATTTTISANPTLVTAGGTSTITVTAKDAFGSARTTSSGTVTLATTSGTLSAVTDNGNGTYTATFTGTSSGTPTISGTIGGNAINSANDASVTVSVAAASQLTITQSPTASPHSGVSFPQQPTIQLRDAQGNAVATSGVHVVASGSGLSGTVDVATDGTGLATYTDLVLTGTAGPRTLTFTVTSPFSATTTANVTLVAGPATQLVISTQPAATATAGIAFTAQPVIQIQDAQGNVVLSDNATVVTASRLGGSGTLQGTLTATAINGVASFTNLAHNVATTITIQFTSVPVFTSATSNNVVVSAGAATQLTIQTQPAAAATAGVAFTTQPIVEVRDAFNNIRTGDNTTVVTATRLSGTGTLQGTLTATAASGVATFTTLAYNVAETITLQFSSGNLTTVTSNSVVVSAAAATAAQTTAAVPAGSAGVLTSITVTTKDAFGNVAACSGGNTVAASVTGANAGTTVAVGACASGVYTLTYTPSVAGTDAIAITVNTTPIGGSPYSSVVGTGTVTSFLVEAAGGGAIGTQTVNTPFNIRVTARDAGGNLVTTFTGTVDISSGTGTLSAGGVTSAAFSAGVLASHAVTFSSTGSNTITATKTGGGPAGTSNSFTVNPAAATALFILTQPSASATAGVAFAQQPVIQIRDAQGNVVTTDNTTIVTASALGGTGTLQGTVTATAAAGVAMFTSLKYNVAETITIHFTSTSPVLTAATSNNVVVAASAATQLTVSQSPTASPHSGVSFPQQPTIQLRDAQGNAVATSGVHVVASGSGLSGTVDVATDGTGLATYTDLVLTGTAGPRTLTFTVTSPFSATTTANVTLVAGPATQLVISTQPAATATAGIAFTAQPVIQIQDAQGNVVTTDNATTVTAAAAGGADVLHGTLTVTAVNGVGTFTSLSYNTAETIHVNFSSTPGLTTPSSTNVVVSAGAATQLTILTQPTTATAGAAFSPQPVVQVKDAFGNIRTTDNTTVVTAARGTTGTGTLQSSGTLTATAASGVATFSGLFYTLAETMTLHFSSGNLTPATSTNVVVSAAAVSTAQTTASVPAGSAGTQTSIMVQIKDAFGNNETTGGATVAATVTGANAGATVASHDNTNGTYTLTYTPTAIGTDAIAITFNGTAISGSPYTSVVSSSGTATKYVVTSSGSSPAAGTSVTITAQLADNSNNPVATSGKTVNWSSSGGGQFASPTSVTDATGRALVTFTVTTVTPTTQTVTATDNTALTGTSGNINVVAGPLNNFALSLTSPQTDGIAFSGTNTLTARDAFNNTVTTFNASTDNVTIAANAPLVGTVSGLSGGNKLTLAGDFVSGVANLSGLTYTGTTNTGTFTASSGATNKTGTSGAVEIDAGVATHFVIAGSGTQTAGASQLIAIAAQDVGNNTATGYTGDKDLTFGGASIAPDGTTHPTVEDKSNVQQNFGNTTTITFASGTASRLMRLYAVETAHVAASAAGPITTPSPLSVAVSPATTDAAQSTVIRSNPGAEILADNTANETITVTLKDAFQNVVPGKQVSLAGNPPTTTTVTPGIASNGSGQAVFAVKDNVAETVTYTATASDPGAITITQTQSVTFVASQLALSGNSAPTAGTGFAVTVTAKDGSGAAASNFSGSKTLTFSFNPAGTHSAPGGQTPTVNGSDFGTPISVNFVGGIGLVLVVLYKAEAVALDATTSAPTTPTISSSGGGDPLSVTVSPATTDAAQSTVLRTGPDNVTADGASSSTITVTLKDQFDNLVSGKTVSLVANVGSPSVITTPGGTTSDGSGQVAFTVTDTLAETVTYTATANDAGTITITQTAAVTFVPGPVSTAASGSTVSAVPTSLSVSGTNTSLITVQLKDAHGNNITTNAGTVTLSADDGTGSLNFTPVTYAGGGSYTATFTATVPAGVIITAAFNTSSLANTVTLLVIP